MGRQSRTYYHGEENAHLQFQNSAEKGGERFESWWKPRQRAAGKGRLPIKSLLTPVSFPPSPLIPCVNSFLLVLLEVDEKNFRSFSEQILESRE